MRKLTIFCAIFSASTHAAEPTINLDYKILKGLSVAPKNKILDKFSLRKNETKSLINSTKTLQINQHIATIDFVKFKPKVPGISSKLKTPKGLLTPKMQSDNDKKDKMSADNQKRFVEYIVPKEKNHFDEMEDALFKGK